MSAPADVVVGAVYPLSGPDTALGRNAVEGLRLGVDEVNAAGGVPSLGGARLRLELGDHVSSPERGAAETEALVARGASVVLGAWHSAVTMAASAAADRLPPRSSTPSRWGTRSPSAGSAYVFRLVPSNRTYARATCEFLEDVVDAQRGSGWPPRASSSRTRGSAGRGPTRSARRRRRAASAWWPSWTIRSRPGPGRGGGAADRGAARRRDAGLLRQGRRGDPPRPGAGAVPAEGAGRPHHALRTTGRGLRGRPPGHGRAQPVDARLVERRAAARGRRPRRLRPVPAPQSGSPWTATAR